MSLLSAHDDGSMPVARIRQGGEAFGFSENAIRIALMRLVQEGKLKSEERGIYSIAQREGGIFGAIRGWTNYPAKTAPWDGRWIAVHTADLPKRDRKQNLRRERALTIKGFRQGKPGPWMRPANLSANLDELREDLTNLGLEGTAFIMMGEAQTQTAPNPEDLYDRHGLERAYELACTVMAKSQDDKASQSIADKARETLLIGSAVIYLLTYDPLLPAQLVNVTARDAVYETMLTYDEFGQKAWDAYHAQLERNFAI